MLGRNREKINQVVTWLYRFDFSNRLVLSKMLGVANAGQGVFYQTLEKSGLVSFRTPVGLRHRFYFLTAVGVEQAKFLLPDLERSRRKSIPSWSLVVHALCIQAIIVSRMSEIGSFRPERDLKEARAHHLPDALMVMKGGKKIAVEVELSRKSNPRVYNIFLSHLKNIGLGHYDEVQYFFESAELMAHYKMLYLEQIWPIFVINSRGKLESAAGRGGFDSVQAQRDGCITFSTESMVDVCL